MPSHTLIPQLSLQSMFWRPKFVKDSVWSVHLPVAFWLIEAQRPQRVVELGTQEGTSWFAFCQALERLNPYAECLGFTAGPPDAALLEYTETQYQELARVRQASQTDALEQLAEGSVDVLHVAPGVAKPISREWAQWQARLSARGVVLISQAGPGQPGESLYRQLREGRAHFFFEQAQGLAVVAVGAQQSESLERLLSFQPGQPSMRLVQQVFQRLGLACCATDSSSRPGAQAGSHDSEATGVAKRRQDEVAREAAEAVRQKAESDQQEAERRITALEQDKSHLDTILQARDQELEALRASHRRLEELQATRFDETAKLTELLQTVEAAQSNSQARIGELGAEKRQALDEVERQLELLKAAEAAQANSQARIDELEAEKRQALDEAERQRRALDALQQNYLALEQRHEQQTRELEQKGHQLTALETAKKETDQQQAQQQRRLDAAERAQAMLQEESATLRRQQQSRFEELAELTRMLDEKEQRLAELSEQPKRLTETFATLGKRAKGRGNRRASKKDLRLVKDSGFYDEAWYAKRYPDVEQGDMSGLEHFVNFGGQEGRAPGPAFDSQWYLLEYPDVAQAKLNPLVHYLRFGRQEDRLPMPEAWQGEKHGS